MHHPSLGAAVLAIGVLASACTSMPRPSGVLSDYSQLQPPSGVLAKRRAHRPDSPLSETSPIYIETLAYAPGLEGRAGLDPDQLHLVLNRLGRDLCEAMASRFVVVDEALPDGFRLRAFITDIRPTGRVAAAISAPLDMMSPLIGVRLPLGLGALEVEVELVDAQGTSVAAMIWRRDADMTVSGASVSRISDVYVFAGDAAAAFSELFEDDSASRRAARLTFGIIGGTGLPSGGAPACKSFGRARELLDAVTGLIGPGLPPEMVDSGAEADQAEPYPMSDERP